MIFTVLWNFVVTNDYEDLQEAYSAADGNAFAVYAGISAIFGILITMSTQILIMVSGPVTFHMTAIFKGIL